ncbi:hypothetical protein CENSYa_1787 [Cenarchaeum symbiosum A]|uniref:Uncharacterized protein n=1 Tax=Cenarchaeum symbiosum (strain A) TaxID=414004 RepID=A0RYI0_CENSY|nr:hypothetical protein CENSYa_1787 [Cenarchaeum symbiosum A]
MRRKCPKCGSKKVVEIMYGLPPMGDQWKKDLDEGKFVLGGCCVTNHDPKWYCKDCSLEFYKLGEIPPEAGWNT